GRWTTTWQGIVRRRTGADALLDAIEQLQGAPLPASILETEILPARIDVYDPADLDAVTAAGEVVWVGVEPLGDRDGRIALYLADHLPRLLPPTSATTAPLKRRPTDDNVRGAPLKLLPPTAAGTAPLKRRPTDDNVRGAPLQRGLSDDVDLSDRER